MVLWSGERGLAERTIDTERVSSSLRGDRVSVRIGIALGPRAQPDGFADAVDRLEAAGVDSLWLSELVFGPHVEPVVGMAHALSRTTRLKVGTGVSVLPGRQPVLVAKQLTSLAALAPGRVLPAFGLRPARDPERQLFDVPPGRRAAVFDEAMQLLRLLLSQDEVTFHGEFFTVERARIGPRPAKPLDIWLGGTAPAGLRRAGRFADGWLASLVTPEHARLGREAIQAAAAEAEREIEPDHFGISLPIATDGIPDELIARVRRRQPDVELPDLIPTGWQHARDLIERYVEAGLTKFVVRPASAATPFTPFLDRFTTELMPLQS